jgi:hypothetical protein
MLVDLRHLSRNLRRSPASAVAAILTLSLTLGAGASIFAVVDAVLLTPPPFTNPDALVTVGETPIDEPTAAPRAVSYAAFAAWRVRAESLATLEASDGTNLTLTELGAAERVSGSNVTPGFLTLLGVTPARGRAFHLDDVGQRVVIPDARGPEPVQCAQRESGVRRSRRVDVAGFAPGGELPQPGTSGLVLFRASQSA